MWPIAFLCMQRGLVCGCLAEDILYDPIQKLDQSQPEICLWEIEAECGHENCRLQHCIYAKYRPDKTAQDVIGRLLKTNPRIPCTGDHDAPLRAEKMRVTELAF